MDVAYDHIQEEALSPDEAAEKARSDGKEGGADLNAEFAEAYKAITSSPWGARFGALVGTVKKQGESYYEEAQKEYTAASSQASKGFNDILNRTRSISIKQPSLPTLVTGSGESKSTTTTDPSTTPKAGPRSDSEAQRESDGILSRFRSEATKRLKDIEKAEDAADEALLRFGTNISNFFKDAVSIAPPIEGQNAVDKDGKSVLLFESKDRDGKRVIHTTRFEAQLHAIHSSPESFKKDPISPEFASYKEGFSIDKQTEAIAGDLGKFKELREAMEQLVPDQVKYEDFWTRYYFLRHVVESEEQRRKELLRGVNADTEEVGWDEDSDTETAAVKPTSIAKNPASMESTSTLLPGGQRPAESATDVAVKPTTSRRSNDQQSQPDSDASYDLVSGATSGVPSRAPGSPREAKKTTPGEESDEEDWE